MEEEISKYGGGNFQMMRPYIDKSEDNFLRAVVSCQLVPDREEATQRWSRVGARQNHLKNNVEKLASSYMVNIWYIFSFISALGQWASDSLIGTESSPRHF